MDLVGPDAADRHGPGNARAAAAPAAAATHARAGPDGGGGDLPADSELPDVVLLENRRVYFQGDRHARHTSLFVEEFEEDGEVVTSVTWRSYG